MRKQLNFLFFLVLTLVAFSRNDAFAQKTYVVAVGLGNYDNPSLCPPLPMTKADVTDVCKFFDNYNNSEVFMITDKNATRDHIMRVLNHQFAKSTPADEIIFVYSGHGFDGGLTCYDTKNVVYCTEIQDILRKAKARRKVMFINSCHSGSFSKKYGDDPRARSYKDDKSNIMLFLSSRSDESSWAATIMRNSFFINRLLMALQGKADANGDKKVTARELFNYVYERVIDDTDGQQHPQMYGKFPDDMVVVYVK